MKFVRGKRNCRSDFFCLEGEKKFRRGKILKKNKIATLVFGNLEYGCK